ncbi:MAG TPA: glutamine--tRNA ligase [Spirochaetia bacterium]|nr:glutamine--tRNA ligase [Spirochaetia bacterium]
MSENSTINNNDFIREIIKEDLAAQTYKTVITRFPPEPNGYLHIGHAKSICINFGLAAEFGGRCHLRFDDTNPEKEEQEFIDSIKDNIRWLGFDWKEHEYFASSYFEQLFEFAVKLVKKGCAYVDDQSAEEIRKSRGTLTEPGKASPYRSRSIEENLNLFIRMRAGDFKDGEKTLRAKIDMTSPNLNMRDPVMYRIMHRTHHQTKDQWCIYPMYDFTHGQSDALENISHSICTLEFEDHRPLYDWFIKELGIHHPRQIEFARLNLTFTVMSKRKLLKLVQEKHVNGWNDPRLPTISGLRRRGYTPCSIRDFCIRIGIAKANSTVDVALLEHCLREDLNKNAQRMMAVINPVKLVVDNYPVDRHEEFQAENNPENPAAGSRPVIFSRTLYIERDDFMEHPAKGFFRLFPGGEVRLKYAWYIKCTGIIKDPSSGEITEIHCTYDPATRGGWSTDGRKVKGTLHWLSAAHAQSAEFRMYDRLFTAINPEAGDKEFTEYLNPRSLEIKKGFIEPVLASAAPLQRFQFLRTGYFCTDTDSSRANPVFNRITGLKDTWAKIMAKNE